MKGGVGNDVVDLRDRDARPETLHPGFDARAFHEGERAFIGVGPSANRRRWSLWVAKEAAHKALRQERPELGFAPRHYRVELDARTEHTPHRGIEGTVRRGGEVFAVRVTSDAERVHAVAFRAGSDGVVGEVATLVELGEADPSRAVRALLCRSLADAGDFALERRERIPRLRLDGCAVALSFSHHGRFVALARGGDPSLARGRGPS
jgi:phosphopantetheinyl transferase (holo-ACP synthase)